MKTLEEYISMLTDYETKDLIFVLRRFGGNTGIMADKDNVKFFRKAYADACIERALNSNDLTSEGAFYIKKLREKLL